jgi:hypothetical protein
MENNALKDDEALKDALTIRSLPKFLLLNAFHFIFNL